MFQSQGNTIQHDLCKTHRAETDIIKKQKKQYTRNVTLRRGRVTIVAVEKQ